MPQLNAEDRKFLLPGLVLLALVASLGIFVCVDIRNGIGISSDSLAYLDAARNFAQGRGLTHFNEGQMEVLTQWPPLYPLMLSVSFFGGVSPDIFIPLLNVVLLVVLIFAVGYAVASFLKSSSAGICAALLAVLSADTARIFSMAWSEPLFLTLTFVSLLVFSKYQRTLSLKDLCVCCVLASAAFLTRYPGVVLTGCIGLFVLLKQYSSFKEKALHFVVFSLAGVFPAFLWILRNKGVSGEAVQVELSYHPEAWGKLRDIGEIVLSWFVPYRLYGAAVFLLLGLGVYFLVFRWKSLAEGVKAFLTHAFWKTVCLWILMYVGFLLGTALFLKEIDFDFRMLAPVRWVIVPMAAAVGWTIFSGRKGRFWRVTGILLLGVWVVFSCAKTWTYVRAIPGESAYYCLNGLKSSGLMDWVKDLPPDAVVYSNVSTIVHHFTGRETFPLPRKMIPVKRLVNENYAEEMAGMVERLRSSQGYVVYFSAVNWRKHLVSEEELKGEYPLKLIRSTTDGVVYQMD